MIISTFCLFYFRWCTACAFDWVCEIVNKACCTIAGGKFTFYNIFYFVIPFDSLSRILS